MHLFLAQPSVNANGCLIALLILVMPSVEINVEYNDRSGSKTRQQISETIALRMVIVIDILKL